MNQTNKVFYTLVAIFLSCSIEMAGQVQKVISGTVTELFGKTAEPLVGVNVNLVNNQNRSLGGGITNLNGQYNVKVPEGEKDLTIVYSYIGMKTKRIKYTGQTLLNVTFKDDPGQGGLHRQRASGQRPRGDRVHHRRGRMREGVR